MMAGQGLKRYCQRKG